MLEAPPTAAGENGGKEGPMKTLTVTALLLTAAAARARDAALTFGDGNFILDYSRTLFNNAPLGDLQPGEFFSGVGRMRRSLETAGTKKIARRVVAATRATELHPGGLMGLARVYYFSAGAGRPSP